MITIWIALALLVVSIVVCRHYHYLHQATSRTWHYTLSSLSGAVGSSCTMYLILSAILGYDALSVQVVCEAVPLR